MQILHESLNRILNRTTLCGYVTRDPASKSGEPTDSVELTWLIEDVRHCGGHHWEFDVLMTAGGNGQQLVVHGDVRWAGSVPVITFSDLEVPLLGRVDAQLMIHNGRFSGTWRHGRLQGYAFGRLQHKESPAHQRRYVIERSSECLRDWWTGTGWSENADDAKWFENEPRGPFEADDEDAHIVFYASGTVESG